MATEDNRTNHSYYFMKIKGVEIQFHEVLQVLGLNKHHHVAAAMEYLARWHNKDGLNDLLKARWRINRAIEEEVFGSADESKCHTVHVVDAAAEEER